MGAALAGLAAYGLARMGANARQSAEEKHQIRMDTLQGIIRQNISGIMEGQPDFINSEPGQAALKATGIDQDSIKAISAGHAGLKQQFSGSFRGQAAQAFQQQTSGATPEDKQAGADQFGQLAQAIGLTPQALAQQATPGVAATTAAAGTAAKQAADTTLAGKQAEQAGAVGGKLRSETATEEATRGPKVAELGAEAGLKTSTADYYKQKAALAPQEMQAEWRKLAIQQDQVDKEFSVRQEANRVAALSAAAAGTSAQAAEKRADAYDRSIIDVHQNMQAQRNIEQQRVRNEGIEKFMDRGFKLDQARDLAGYGQGELSNEDLEKRHPGILGQGGINRVAIAAQQKLHAQFEKHAQNQTRILQTEFTKGGKYEKATPDEKGAVLVEHSNAAQGLYQENENLRKYGDEYTETGKRSGYDAALANTPVLIREPGGLISSESWNPSTAADARNKFGDLNHRDIKGVPPWLKDMQKQQGGEASKTPSQKIIDRALGTTPSATSPAVPAAAPPPGIPAPATPGKGVLVPGGRTVYPAPRKPGAEAAAPNARKAEATFGMRTRDEIVAYNKRAQERNEPSVAPEEFAVFRELRRNNIDAETAAATVLAARRGARTLSIPPQVGLP